MCQTALVRNLCLGYSGTYSSTFRPFLVSTWACSTLFFLRQKKAARKHGSRGGASLRKALPLVWWGGPGDAEARCERPVRVR